MVKNGWADQSYITQPKRPRGVEGIEATSGLPDVYRSIMLIRIEVWTRALVLIAPDVVRWR